MTNFSVIDVGLGHAIGEDAELRRLLESAAAVSFDFFDTLFTRPLLDPEDAFDLLGEKFSIPDFRERRRAAQAEAFRRMQAVGRKEITLANIYDCFAPASVSASELMRAEYALELELLEPIPDVFNLFRELWEAGKPLVITSDMYLSADFFREVLRPYGLEDVLLFISADCNATKRDTGELFDLVASRLGISHSKLLHIGDSPLGDVQMPREKGLMVYHYRSRRPVTRDVSHSLAGSIAHGLLRTSAPATVGSGYAELGFLYGGPAAVGFLGWVRERARADEIDQILFLSRDGFVLDRIARELSCGDLPTFRYFLGSRTAFTLAAMTPENFGQFVPFLLSGSEGLAPRELLERVGVNPPAPRIMEELGLGDQVRVAPAQYEAVTRLLHAYRWEILKVCQRNRRALYQYLHQSGIRPGSRVALVDVGWSGTTQEAFEMAVLPMLELDVFGYYFCLADTSDRQQRDSRQKMASMLDSTQLPAVAVARLHANRVAVEMLFSAPHPSVIGLLPGKEGIEPVYDPGRGDVDALPKISEELSQGIEAFARNYAALQRRFDPELAPARMVEPLIDLFEQKQGSALTLLKQIKSFDAWGSSRNHMLKLADYLAN